MTVEEIIRRTRLRIKGKITHEEAFGVFPIVLPPMTEEEKSWGRVVSLPPPPAPIEQRTSTGQSKPILDEFFGEEEDPFAGEEIGEMVA